MATKAEKHLGGNWGAWVWVKWKNGAPSDALTEWENIDGIKEAWSTTGTWDCALWIDVNSPDEVEKLVWKEIKGNKWVEKTDTHFAKKYW